MDDRNAVFALSCLKKMHSKLAMVNLIVARGFLNQLDARHNSSNTWTIQPPFHFLRLMGVVLFISLALSGTSAFAFGQKSDICNSGNNYCNGGVQPAQPAPQRRSGPSSWQPPVNVGPSAAELERRQRSREANDRGVQCANRENSECAIQNYEEAIRLYPNNATARKNLRKSRAQQLNEIGIEYYDHEKWDLAVQYFQKALSFYGYDSIRQNLANAKSAQLRQARKEAERLRSEAMVQKNQELDELNASMADINHLSVAPNFQVKPFGIKSNIDAINIVDLSPREVIPDKNKTAQQQLQGIKHSGTLATIASTSVGAKGKAGIGFDTPGYEGYRNDNPDVVDLRGHAIHETHLRIPKGLKSSFKVKSLARKWQKLEKKYQKYEIHRQQLQKSLADAYKRRDQKTGKAPDPIQIYDLKKKLNEAEYNQALTEKKQQQIQEKISFNIDIGSNKKKKPETTDSGQKP